MSGPARTHEGLFHIYFLSPFYSVSFKISEIDAQMSNRKRKAPVDLDEDGQIIEKVAFGGEGGYDEVRFPFCFPYLLFNIFRMYTIPEKEMTDIINRLVLRQTTKTIPMN